MQTDLSMNSEWVHSALLHFPNSIQDSILLKMIEADNIRRDAMAQLRVAERLKGMGFSILEGNHKDGVFRAQHAQEDPIWVVSCYLSRYVGDSLKDRSSLTSLQMAKKRAINSCLTKIPSGESVMLCMNVDPESFHSSVTDPEDFFANPREARRTSAKGLTGMLVSFGDPKEERIEWEFYRHASVK